MDSGRIEGVVETWQNGPWWVVVSCGRATFGRGRTDSRSGNEGSSVLEMLVVKAGNEDGRRAWMQSSHINRPQHCRCRCALGRGVGCFSSSTASVELEESRLAQVQHDCISIATEGRVEDVAWC